MVLLWMLEVGFSGSDSWPVDALTIIPVSCLTEDRCKRIDILAKNAMLGKARL